MSSSSAISTFQVYESFRLPEGIVDLS